MPQRQRTTGTPSLSTSTAVPAWRIAWNADGAAVDERVVGHPRVAGEGHRPQARGCSAPPRRCPARRPAPAPTPPGGRGGRAATGSAARGRTRGRSRCRRRGPSRPPPCLAPRTSAGLVNGSGPLSVGFWNVTVWPSAGVRLGVVVAAGGEHERAQEERYGKDGPGSFARGHGASRPVSPRWGICASQTAATCCWYPVYRNARVTTGARLRRRRRTTRTRRGSPAARPARRAAPRTLSANEPLVIACVRQPQVLLRGPAQASRPNYRRGMSRRIARSTREGQFARALPRPGVEDSGSAGLDRVLRSAIALRRRATRRRDGHVLRDRPARTPRHPGRAGGAAQPGPRRRTDPAAAARSGVRRDPRASGMHDTTRQRDLREDPATACKTTARYVRSIGRLDVSVHRSRQRRWRLLTSCVRRRGDLPSPVRRRPRLVGASCGRQIDVRVPGSRSSDVPLLAAGETRRSAAASAGTLAGTAALSADA